MAKSLGIIAYGTPEDRERVKALAKLEGISNSEWIIARIRKEYDEKIGAPLTLPKE
jgi:hypothetical protein